jgi:hypothetical protein
MIALMLGRLKMSIKECEAEFERISKEVFVKSAVPLKGRKGTFLRSIFYKHAAMYDHKSLEKNIKRVVFDKSPEKDPELMMFDEENWGNPHCRV